ncbi:MAG: trimethylamine methyltransferase family protein, partial [Rhizobiales bacterium]|nr:trimethylamine methyltransferase family protein [Hyphomicrobiales bacterium]
MTQPGETQRRRRIGDRRGAPIAQMPWRQLVNPLPPTKLISDDEVEALHEAALTILETIGIRCQVAEAREIFRRAGAIIDETDARVCVGRDIVEAALTTVPSQFVMTPRNPAREVRIGNEFLTTAAVLGPPNCSDLERGRRSGTLADFTDFLKLTQVFNIVQM